MRRAFSTLGCAELALEEVLALAARHGIPCVELRALEGTVKLPTLFERRYGSPERLAARLAEAPARVVSIGTSLRLIGNTLEDRGAFLRFLPWAEAMGVDSLRVFDGGRIGDVAGLEEAREALSWWRRLRRERGRRAEIAVETHDALADPTALRRFLEMEPGCPILWDSHHTWRKGGAHPAELWRMLRPHVAHIHVKDSLSRPSERFDYSYVLPGEGEFPMQALMAALRADGYAGLLSLEWERLWHRDLPDLETALDTAERRRWW
ncbi:sugar phosphate isomerase/epimerase [Roseomonas gilardii subsp. gilardii]|uniref:sugar phosphate isomerase/epimerase family protein n=1 Tax=Roseomonas gilardii TaxID=257708 RepID=UPI001FFA334D|nr:sugar phosphate isomerase/epimerase [Roseomonas gilardii]UPG73312.1 sugar phosphate isomerase/epimerase [Roseomonas gilardii subsp. gilardii]